MISTRNQHNSAMDIDSGRNRIIISHLTDVEGNWRYFQHWIRRSGSLHFKQKRLDFCASDSKQQFIYGGDFCDKGPGDLRIGQALVDLKLRYPQDVFLIAGNREIKCRRFTYELSCQIKQRLLYGKAPFWNPFSSPRQYVINQLKKEGVQSPSESEIDQFVLNKSTIACQRLYLKWMLEETMGCGVFLNKPNTFEYRRMELAELSNVPTSHITDEMVTQSFIDSVAPTGVITAYLQHAQLGVIIGETLFIHGAVTPENMGFVPGQPLSQVRISDAKEWIATLNDWYSRQINAWLAKPYEDELQEPGHLLLDRYVIANPKSIVTSNWYTHGKLSPIAPSVVAFLNKAGIYRVVSGHQPFSDFPLVIREENLEVIVGDTSYSDRAAVKDNRGDAIHNLKIIQFPYEGYAVIDALRKDRSATRLNLPTRAQVKRANTTSIGHFTSEGLLIRPGLGNQLLCSQLEGFKVIDEPFQIIHFNNR